MTQLSSSASRSGFFAALLLLVARVAAAEFLPTGSFDETQATFTTAENVRVVINAPLKPDPAHPWQLIIYALPNGNSIEWTIGRQRAPKEDWHFDIQHIGAQMRLLRTVCSDRNIAIAYVEAEGKSWPAWRGKHVDSPKLIRTLVSSIAKALPIEPQSICLSAHSGGGSFIIGYLNDNAAIDARVKRILFLDANYSYSDEEHHGDKLLQWLRHARDNTLVVIAYDDRHVTFDGKPIVSETGGTYRATHRMLDRFALAGKLDEDSDVSFERFIAQAGQARFILHRNPDNKILHTTLVGEMSGFLHGVTIGTPAEGKWGRFAETRTYDRFIASAPATMPATQPQIVPIPQRAADAESGSAFATRVAALPADQRESAIEAALLSGNLPAFMRNAVAITIKGAADDGRSHELKLQVMPDYLCIGSDDDFLRIPMTPMTARRIAGAWGFVLPTRVLVDAIYQQAAVKLEPRPLTEQRELITTFQQHDRIIRDQLLGKVPGLLVAGIKKDVVLTNRLREKPNRVAIYGWHQLDGNSIQPLTIVHKETYVDYSHGIRLIRRSVELDGKPMDIAQVLNSAAWCALLSDEGPIDIDALP